MLSSYIVKFIAIILLLSYIVGFRLDYSPVDILLPFKQPLPVFESQTTNRKDLGVSIHSQTHFYSSRSQFSVLFYNSAKFNPSVSSTAATKPSITSLFTYKVPFAHMGKLYFRHGAVSSAKTMNLLAVAHTYRQQGKQVLLMKPVVRHHPTMRPHTLDIQYDI